MLKAEGLRTVNWNAPDLQAAERFYTEVLGGTAARHQIGGVEVAHVRIGESVVGLFDASGGARPGVPHHTFRMAWPAEPEAAKASLEASGATVQNTRIHGAGPGFSLYVEDPIGNRLELSWDPPS